MNLYGGVFTASTYLVAVALLAIKSNYLKLDKLILMSNQLFLCQKLFYYIFQKEFPKWNFINLHVKTERYSFTYTFF